MTQIKTQYDDNAEAELIRLWTAGDRVSEIARKTNRSIYSVRTKLKHLRKAGTVDARRLSPITVKKIARDIYDAVDHPHMLKDLALTEYFVRLANGRRALAEEHLQQFQDQSGRCVYSGAAMSPNRPGLVPVVDPELGAFACDFIIRMKQDYKAASFIALCRVIAEKDRNG
jgi:DNA-binding CsgD family transcriptional regulator